MVQEAAIERDYNFIETATETFLEVTRNAPIRTILLMFPVAVLCVLAFCAAVWGIIDSAPLSFVISAVSLLIAWPLQRWSNKKTKDIIRITKDGIVASNTLYRYSNISVVGVHRAHANTIYNPNSAQGVMINVASQLGNSIYVTYGTKKVAIATGLGADIVDQLYDDLLQVLRRYGFETR